MEESSVEVSEESRRGSKVSLDVVHPVSQAVDSYRIPVIFDKDSPRQERLESGEREDVDGSKYACIVSEEERPELEAALESLGRLVCYSADGHTLPDHIPDNCDMVFVCEQFEGEAYNYLHSRKLRILGPPCVMSCSSREVELPNSIRPVYSSLMEGVIICFTGFKDKGTLQHLCSLAHQMGASIRRDMATSITHVVAYTVTGSKYKVAVTRGTPIMSPEWVERCWEQREDLQANAIQPPLANYKQLPFQGCVIGLHGFSQAEVEDMKEIAVLNGAECKRYDADGVTHCVVEDSEDLASYPTLSSRIHLVKSQWFWESIQIEACADEQLYLAKGSSTYRRNHHSGSGRRPGSSSRYRLTSNTSASLHTSVSSIDISCLLEASIFSLSSPVSTKGHGKSKKSPVMSPLVVPPSPTSGLSVTSHKMEDTARRHIASELLQTETNFVEILNLIVTVFQEPLERQTQRGGPILSHEDIKSIFGNTAEILSVHRHLVSGLHEQLSSWNENSCIGDVVLRQSDALLRVYPPFVNYFDMSKDALQRCDRLYPRFHAFLKSNESRPECGRQTLAELLISPVQRIPRIILLLKDLVKRTSSQHPDSIALQRAVQSLETVMTHINEDRRKTEGQMQMFEVLRDVEGCPANVLSAQRSFLRKLDVLDIGNPSKGTKGDPLTIFIFSDSLEVAKRRMASGFGLRNTPARNHKHLEFIPFTHIRSVVQFGDSGDYSNCFGILMYCLDDPIEKLLLFRLSGGGGVASGPEAREGVVQQLAKLMAASIFSTDTDQFIVDSSADILNSMCKTNLSATVLRKALHGARKKVRRAFSGRNGGRKQNLASSSVHQDLHGIGEENELPVDLEDPHNTSAVSATSILPPLVTPSRAPSLTSATPVSALHTPKPKRPALSRLSSFSAADVSHVGHPM